MAISGCGGGSETSETTAPSPPPGSLDSSFGTGGKVITPIGLGAQANAIVLQPDGKIIAAGFAEVQTASLTNAFALIRYNTDGTLDSGFGTAGKVISTSFISSLYAQANGVTLQPDGKIVVAGYSQSPIPHEAVTNCIVTRLNADGSPDPSFGTGGVVFSRVTSLFNEHASCSAPTVLPDGKILVALSSGGDAGYFGLMRFNANGTSDSSFGLGGMAVFQTTHQGGRASSVVVQPDGKVVVGGGSVALVTDIPPTFVGEYLLARFYATGILDPTFGQSGVVRGSIPGDVTATVGGMALQPDNKIVAAVTRNVLRFLPNGTPDPAFGVGGTVAGILGSGLAGPGVALQSNGKIVIAGTASGNATTPQIGFALWRFNPDGTLDSGFGNGGSVTTPLGSGGIGNAVAIQHDGGIVVAGMAQIPTSPPAPAGNAPNFAVARYFGDPVTTSSQ
ncbi:MAG TPA: hypothetical protein VF959_03740 [Casimicrobiaceae bacterium]